MLAAPAVLAALLMLAPAATADSSDDYYLNGLHAYNIDSTGGSADLIQIGHEICGAISPNVSPSVLTQDIYGRNVYTGRIFTQSLGGAHIPVTSGQVGILVQHAVAAYCPNSEGAAYWGVRP